MPYEAFHNTELSERGNSTPNLTSLPYTWTYAHGRKAVFRERMTRAEAMHRGIKVFLPTKTCFRGHDAPRKVNGGCFICRRKRDKSGAWRKTYYLRTYGIALEDYEALVEEQGGVCALCFGKESRRLHVDHSHITGEIRGLLCFSCNRALGGFKDSPVLLRRAAEYLERGDSNA